jgi:LAO/AO transport system kinase
MGDDVQALKAGIMEIADVFAINKADLPGADRLEQEIRTMQNLGNVAERADAAPIRRIVATAGTGVNELMDAVRAVYRNRIKKNSRSKIWAIRLREILRDTLLESLPDAEVEAHAERVSARLEDPYAAVDALRALIGLYPKSQA